MDLVKDNVEFMDESNFNILPSETVFEAAKKIRDKSITALIVAGGGENLGIITETDLSRKVIADELNPKETKVKFIMAKPIISVESNCSMMSAF